MLRSYMNRQESILSLIQGIWDALESNISLFVVLTRTQKDSSSYKRVLFAELHDEVKLIRAFVSYAEAERYCKQKEQEFQVSHLSVYSMEYNKLYASICHISAKGDSIECMLTALDVDGKVYDIEEIWNEKIN